MPNTAEREAKAPTVPVGVDFDERLQQARLPDGATLYKLPEGKMLQTWTLEEATVGDLGRALAGLTAAERAAIDPSRPQRHWSRVTFKNQHDSILELGFRHEGSPHWYPADEPLLLLAGFVRRAQFMPPPGDPDDCAVIGEAKARWSSGQWPQLGDAALADLAGHAWEQGSFTLRLALGEVYRLRAALAAPAQGDARRTPDPATPHLIDGEFQSDKYPTTPRGKVPLSCKDPTAQDLLWSYAQRRRAVDAAFAADLETALRNAGYVPPPPPPSALIWTDCDGTAFGPTALLRSVAPDSEQVWTACSGEHGWLMLTRQWDGGGEAIMHAQPRMYRVVSPGKVEPKALQVHPLHDAGLAPVDALRARGWAVAVHNDYRQDGQAYTFWLFTKGERCAKGEGRTDAEALEQAWRAVAAMESSPGAQAP